ncbi:Os11g0129301 [Oryza sativa Japonica Group]|uniref:Os11g0129301 protein n=1 Tax=Oryza sativa subsp. japonica TaxID=39947 RepID=A0A0P0XYJ7_ORYSJ|nr:Os11g0129301 [Oryza sativa Japonica Group]
MFLLCACRYIWSVKFPTLDIITGMYHNEIVPAIAAILGSWPRKIRSGVVKRYIGRRRTAQHKRTIHERCR